MLQASINGHCKAQIPDICLQSINSKTNGFPRSTPKTSENAFGATAHAIIEQFSEAKMPRHLRKTISQAYLENGLYEPIVSPFERELDVNG